jgi:hypothetical protein
LRSGLAIQGPTFLLNCFLKLLIINRRFDASGSAEHRFMLALPASRLPHLGAKLATVSGFIFKAGLICPSIVIMLI